MNILFLFESPIVESRGGIQRVTHTLSEEFAKRGHNVYYLAYTPLAIYEKRFKHSKFAQNQMFLSKSNLFDKENIQYYRKILEEKSIDIVVNQSSLSPQLFNFSRICKCVNPRIRLLSAIHNTILNKIYNIAYIKDNILNKRHMGFLVPLLKRKFVINLLLLYYKARIRPHLKNLVKLSDRVVLTSEALVSEFEEALGRPAKNLCAIENPIAPKETKPPASKEKRILWVGRVDYGKRPDLMLKIWENLSSEFSDWTLDILGDGAYLDSLKAMCTLKNVEFHGMKESAQFYERSPILCCTSPDESFGMVLLEGSQMGCVPVLFNSFPAAKNIIEDKHNGILVPPFDTREYECKLRELIKDGSLRQRLANNAISNAKRFAPHIAAEKWLKLMSN